MANINSLNIDQTPQTENKEGNKINNGSSNQDFLFLNEDDEQIEIESNNDISKTIETAGFNEAEKITVTIADKTTPIVVLFGYPACGKTMTMIRLARYLRGNNYIVEPVRSFRDDSDIKYTKICDNFNDFLDQNNAAKGTDIINFLLLKVSYKGSPICPILEAPGEHYFNPNNPRAPFQPYINKIINSDNRKIWLVFVEHSNTAKNMGGEEKRMNYVSRIQQINKQTSDKDKYIFLFNKIDETPFEIKRGVVNTRNAIHAIEGLYPNIFAGFKNMNPITKLWKSYNCDFLAFQTGSYTMASDGEQTFTPSSDIYPRQLWELIYKRVRGGF